MIAGHPVLRELLVIDGGDVERALAAQARSDAAVALVQRQLNGLATRAGAERLNEALAIDVFELLTPGWARMPVVRDALARSAQTPGKTAIITLGPHDIAATLHPVLALTMAQVALPELRLTLTLRARFSSATLALRDEMIETLAPRDAALDLRLSYEEVLLKERSISMWQLPEEIRLAAVAVTDH